MSQEATRKQQENQKPRQTEQQKGHHEVVSREEWTKRRLALLQEEKDESKRHDAISERKRALPWVKVEKQYVFTGPEGDLSLADLFGNHSQLLLKNFMMGPNQDWQCPGCTLAVAHVDGLLEYFEHHDMAYVVVARAPIEEIEAVRRNMNWKFRWLSSSKSDFNYDFHVSFTPEERQKHKAIYNYREFDPKDSEDLSGHNVFYKDESGQIFHTYGTYGRGEEQFLGIYGFIDVLPRDGKRTAQPMPYRIGLDSRRTAFTIGSYSEEVRSALALTLTSKHGPLVLGANIFRVSLISYGACRFPQVPFVV